MAVVRIQMCTARRLRADEVLHMKTHACVTSVHRERGHRLGFTTTITLVDWPPPEEDINRRLPVSLLLHLVQFIPCRLRSQNTQKWQYGEVSVGLVNELH